MLAMILYEPPPEVVPGIYMEATGIQRALPMAAGKGVLRTAFGSGTSFSVEVPLPEGYDTIISTGGGLASRVVTLSEGVKGNGVAVPNMLEEVKRITGWSWERLSLSLGKSRQAVNNWSNGGEITVANAERLAKLHSTLRYLDRGTAQANQGVLNSPMGDGRVLSDLLDQERFEEVRAIAGSGKRTDVAHLARMAAEAREVDVARNGHWTRRLAAEEVPFEIIPAPGEKRRVLVNRQG